MTAILMPLEDRHHQYLKDESRMTGKAETISFPETVEDVQSIVRELSQRQTAITIQGSRTGIVGGAVPQGGHILNLSKLNRVIGMAVDAAGRFSVRVQPGITLSELDDLIQCKGFVTDDWSEESLHALAKFRKAGKHFWPPDPTERSASVGGVAANDSRGICARHYGAASHHIQGIRVVDAKGELHTITRDAHTFPVEMMGQFHGLSVTDSQPKSVVSETDQGSFYKSTHKDKSTQKDKSIHKDNGENKPKTLLETFLGSEGILGPIVELTLTLQPLPEALLGIVFFFEAEAGAVAFIEQIDSYDSKHTWPDAIPATPEYENSFCFHGKGRDGKGQDCSGCGSRTAAGVHVTAIEFMDGVTLECIDGFRSVNSLLKAIPGWDPRFSSAVYIEIHGTDADCEQTLESVAEDLMETAARCGGDPDNTWAFDGETEISRLRLFRHAAPESVNHYIDTVRQTDPRIFKLGTDMSLPHCSLTDLIAIYRQGLERYGLRGALFGHGGSGHLHVNILPEDYEQFVAGQKLIRQWAREIDERGGQIVTEHGIGQIKKDLFDAIPLPGKMAQACHLKPLLDPDGVWH